MLFFFKLMGFNLMVVLRVFLILGVFVGFFVIGVKGYLWECVF